jgi:penicillin-binding protein A
MDQEKKKKRHVPFRVNLLFFIVFLLFSVLVVRLGVVQIVHGEDYKSEIDRTEDITVKFPVPRGRMFDRNGKVIVDNIARDAITYTNYGANQSEMMDVAKRLAFLIEVKPDKVQERDMKDYWILKYPKRAEQKVLEKEFLTLKKKLEDKKFNKKVYELKLDRISEDDLKELNAEDLEIVAIYRTISSGYALTPQIVKNVDVTKEEFALVSENSEYLPGVDTTTDWDRFYTYDKTLKTILGKVTDTDEGVPKEQLDYFLARDYSQNERVGKSYLEMQYEDILHGQKTKVKNITDKAGNVLKSEVVYEGKKGKDLILTIDMDLQLAVEKILEEELRNVKRLPRTGLLDRAFVVLMDPRTGDVLTMAGKQIGKDGMQDFALGTVSSSYNVGSTVKGATILTGLKTGAISTGTTIHDRPLYIKGTPEKSSWSNNLGTLNPIGALRVSSNVYMFETAIRIGNGHYQPNQPLRLDPEAFNTMRESFGQFGLGTRTGIDLPNEQIGYKGPSDSGKLLDFAIGQYDTYTPMQMAQYVSTIANGGYRIQPRLVKEIREPLLVNDELGPISVEMNPTILNKLDMKSGWMETVQEGFRQVMQAPSGTATKKFSSAPYSPAGKTGTAEAFYDGPEKDKYSGLVEVMNLSLVGYAPHNNPEMAMSVIVPWAYQGASGHSVNLEIGRRVMDKYFELKKNR